MQEVHLCFQVIACPHCQGLAKYRTLLSGNTFGTVLYSDGKQLAPMLPTTPAVVKCGFCNTLFWQAAAKKVGTLDDDDLDAEQVNPSWRLAKGITEPTEEEFYAAIDSGLANTVEMQKN